MGLVDLMLQNIQSKVLVLNWQIPLARKFDTDSDSEQTSPSDYAPPANEKLSSNASGIVSLSLNSDLRQKETFLSFWKMQSRKV